MSARWLVVLALVAGCKKQEQAAPVDTDTAPPIPAAELARGKDACTAYVTQVCACATEPGSPGEQTVPHRAFEDQASR